MPIHILEKARAKNVDLSVVDGRLKVRAKPGALDDELRQEITQMKELLIELLTEIQASQLEHGNAVIKPVARAATGSPLSFAQQRLWFIDRHESGSSQYNIPTALTMRGQLNKPALQKALDTLVERHEVLRTTYAEVDDLAVQRVHPPTRFPIDEADLSELDEAARSQEIERLIRLEANTAFDLTRDPMLRARLLRSSATDHVLLFTMHHIASDGWSVGVLTREFVALYGAFCRGLDNPLPPLEIQYADFAHWQRETLRDDVIASQLDYWERQLAGAPTVHRLPLDRARPAEQSFKGKTFTQHLGPDLRQQLNQLANQHGATLFMVLESAFALLLSRWSHQDDVVIGTPIAGRTHSQLEPLIGFFVNTLVFRHRLDGEQSFIQLLLDAKQKALDAYANQDVPFDMVVERLQPKRSLGHSPLFQVLFALQNNEQASLDLPELSIGGLAGGQETIKFDLELAIGENESGLALSWTYALSLFDAGTIERMSRSFEVLLHNIVSAPTTSIHALELGTQADRDEQLALMRRTSALQHDDVCLHTLFERQVALRPQAKAVLFADTSLTYGELDARANRVAHWLIRNGAGPDSVVGLCLERSLDMVVGILAIWKAGSAYLPIDPQYPASRIDYILQDSAARILLTSGDTAAQHAFTIEAMLCLDNENGLAGFPDVKPEAPAPATSNLAYVIYTSGSTGNPKGVCIEHRSLSHLARNLDDITGRPAVWAWMASYVFDASLQGLTRLGYGGCLLVLDDQHKVDVARLMQTLGEHPADIVDCTPSIVESWFNQDASAELPDMIIGGEAISASLWERLIEWQRRYGRTALNVYGPTECCVDSTWTVVSGELPHIGKALGDTSLCILSESGQFVPAGVPGELHIAGVGLARGYLNRPELTQTRFVRHEQSGERLYKTGDIVRRLANGDLEYLGRSDDQVKIRGFRIELGEIEQKLNGLEHVQASAVLAVEGDAGQKRLVAYVVPRQQIDERFVESEYVALLRDSLERSLAAYMVPGAFKILPKMPLTASGKLDKRALAQLDATTQFEDAYAAPRNATESTLCDIWRTILRVDRVGIHDNFFQLGGDSILSIQVVARANKVGIPLTTRQLFASQTIAELALGVADAAPAADSPQQAVEGDLPLLPIQKAFLAADDAHVNHFNQTILLVTPASFDADALKTVVRAILGRHDALRLRFRKEGDAWTATHAPLTDRMVDDSCLLEQLPPDIDPLGEYITQRCEHYQRSIDIGKGPLLRAVHFQGAQTGRLLLVAHHLVVDGVSWRILLADLEQALQSHQSGQPVSLAPKTSSFRQWGAALAEYAASERLRQEQPFWHAQFREVIPPFPMDFQTEHTPRRKSSEVVRVELSAEDTDRLLKECPAAYRTSINELLLTGVYLGMHRWTGSHGVRILLEGHGREDLFDTLDTTQTVGWFTTTYPLALRSDGAAITSVIRNVKEQYRSIPNKGIGYGVLRHLAADSVLAEAEHASAGQLVFNYLGQFDQTFDAESQFQFAPESAGTDIDPERPRDQPLELNGMVAQGRLQFDLSYSSEQFLRRNIETLARHIEDGLRAVIAHCAPDGNASATTRRAEGILTPSDFPMARITADQLNAWQSRYDIENIYPATSMQQGMLFHTMLDAGAYVSQIYPTFAGPLDAELFRQAWQSVVDRYDIFRTVFVGDGEQLHQLVVKSARLPWREEDLRGSSEAEQDRRFEEFRRQDKALGFDVGEAPMQRICVFRLAEDRFKVLWSSHHMLLDGWSTPLVYRDVMATYQASLRGESARLPVAPPYSNYIAWLVAQDRNAAAGYWRDHLNGFRHPTPLVLDRLPGDGKRGHQSCTVQLSRETSDVLQAFAKRSHTTVNTVMQLAWGLLLHRYSGDTDVVFGATISGRPAAVPEVESIVGLFINTIPVRISFEQTDIGQLLSGLHRSFQLSNDFGHMPLAQIQSHTGVAHPTPLFDSLIAFENFPIDAATDASAEASDRGLRMDGLGADEQTNYKITLVATMQDILSISCRYRAEDFPSSAIERMLEQLVGFLTRLPEAGTIDVIRLADDEFGAQVRTAAETVALTRKALDEAQQAAADPEARPVVHPRTRTESDMLQIWQEILEIRIDRIDDNFFDLGGNSIKAMRVASHVAAHFGIERSLRALFVHNTIESLSRHVDEQKRVARERIPVVDKDSPLPLSFCQQPLWVIDQMNGGSAQYNMPVALRLRGELDRDALRDSLERIVERHSVLRTVFIRTDADPLQTILPPGPLDMPVLDLSALDRSARDEAVSAHIREEASTAFDLGRDRLLRVRLLELSDRDHVLLLTMHHIASDGWSIGILTGEFAALYAARREGREAELPELEIQYADYAHWQRSTLADEIEGQWRHWERVLSGAPTLHSLPLDRPRPAQQRFDGAVHDRVIGRDVLSALETLGKRHDATLFMVLQSAFALLLSRWSREQDIVVGSPVAGRPHKQLENLIGFFVNTVVFRYRLAPDKTFAQLLDESRRQAIDAFAHQDIPLDMLVDRLQPERSMSHNPLVQLMFSLQNQDMGDLRLPGLEIEGMGQAVPVTKFDLDLAATVLDGELHLMWRYATSLFDAATIERMAESFEVLLRAIVAEPDLPLLDLPLLEVHAHRRMFETFHGNLADYPSASLIHTLFEAQAAAHPDAVAVACETDTLTYGELNARANALAHHLIEMQVKPDDRVGLCIERSAEMVIGLMGILKAGAAYVPLDPSYPPARLAWMLQDSGAVVTVAHTATVGRLAGSAVPLLCLDDAPTRDALARRSDLNPDARTLEMTSANLAYVIYTSGAAGVPNGVMIEHRSVVNLWAAIDRRLGNAVDRRVALNTSIAYDASMHALTQLLSGACLVVIPQDIRSDGERLLRHLVQQRIGLIDCTPTQLQLLVSAGFLENDNGGECRQVIVGGEPIPRELAERMAAADDKLFLSVYGPTECTVDAALSVIASADHGGNIGRPLDNTRIYILDERRRPVPIGMPGELYIGGAGVARGYHVRPELTAERFVDESIVERWFAGGSDGAQGGGRMFRTGDIGRWLADGTIEHFGRNDSRVMIRGFRIELTEIETVLASCPGVREAAVAVRERRSGEPMLIAYLVTAAGQPLAASALRDQLAVNLPEYMLPGTFVELESIPRKPNGEPDRKALPAPEIADPDHRSYEAPRGEHERTLARIWQELFARERVGRHDNFFDIGGNSIRAIQTVTQAKKAGLDIKIGSIFKLQTIEAICSALETALAEPVAAEGAVGIAPGARTLSAYQRSALEAGTAQEACRSLLFEVDADLTETHFRQKVRELLTRHETLLAVVIERAETYLIRPIGITRELLRTVVHIHDLGGMQENSLSAQREAALRQQESALSMLDGPLLRAALFVGDTSVSVALSVHRVLLDDTQWNALSDEFLHACGGSAQHRVTETRAS